MVVTTIIGIMVIGSAKESVQQTQIMGLILGFFAMIFVSLFDYSFVLKFAWIFYFINIGLLLMVLFKGKKVGGATRWVTIGGIQFQPSELSKILIILFFAYFFMKYQENLNTIPVLVISFALIAGPLVLIKKQPDLSTTIVTAIIFIALLFIAGLSYKIILAVMAIGIPGTLIFLSLVLQPDQKILDDYQYKRIMGWLEPEKYSDSAYQQQNSIMAIGSGQLWGKGLNNSEITSVKNGNFISEPQTDFIFAVLGEELGFVRTCAIIILLFLIVFECIMVARKAKDLAGRLICCGMATLVGFQTFVNICVTTGLMPNTGLPLPFVSYGVTSLLTLYLGMGVVLNVSLQPKKYKATSDF